MGSGHGCVAAGADAHPLPPSFPPPLPSVQRAYYKALHESKMHILLASHTRKNMPASRNLLMELRHCCNHPFLLTGVEEDFERRKVAAAAAAQPPQPPPTHLELLISASGKMVLLAKLLPKLQADGHKARTATAEFVPRWGAHTLTCCCCCCCVLTPLFIIFFSFQSFLYFPPFVCQVLIFSQFKLVLNLLQDMCFAQGWHAERLDGDTGAAERQAGIDRFNTPGKGFVYLLSTRAGGMGITLTAADTAIIYDSDWRAPNRGGGVVWDNLSFSACT